MDYDQRHDEALMRAEEERVYESDHETRDEPDPEREAEPMYEPMETRDSEDSDPEEDPLEVAPVDPALVAPVDPAPVDPVDYVPAEDLAGDDSVWTNIPMYPLPPVGSPAPVSPLWSPIATEDSEEFTPYDADTEIAPESEPEMPPPPPVPMISTAEHDWLMAGVTADLVVACARVDELRFQLAEERRVRRCTHTETGDYRLRRVRLSTREIERRARSRLRSVYRSRGGRIRRRDAVRILSRAMERVRDATLSTYD